MGFHINRAGVPTRIGYGNQRNTEIDYILVHTPPGKKLKESKCIILEPKLSDHHPILTTFKFPDISRPTIRKSKRLIVDNALLKEREHTLRQLFLAEDFNPRTAFEHIQ